MNRRHFLSALLAAMATAGLSSVGLRRALANDGAPALPDAITRISKTDAEWKAQLSPASYNVLWQEGTERPFTSPLNDEHRAGIFSCAGCDLALFTSETKFDSGTGWPSFYAPIAGHIETRQDFKLMLPRTEYHCTRCGGHQGHVFNDGPKPTGLRHCNNGVALKFTAR